MTINRDFQSQEHAIIVQRGCVYSMCAVACVLVLSCFGGEGERSLSQIMDYFEDVCHLRRAVNYFLVSENTFSI